MYLCEVDHSPEPVVPVHLSALSMPLDMYYKRLFLCGMDNLKCTCKECHKKQSKQQMEERKKWRRKEKWLVLRIKNGSMITIKKVLDLKDPILYDWDIIDWAETRKEADAIMRKAKKKKEN